MVLLNLLPGTSPAAGSPESQEFAGKVQGLPHPAAWQLWFACGGRQARLWPRDNRSRQKCLGNVRANTCRGLRLLANAWQLYRQAVLPRRAVLLALIPDTD
jgi:hypothetical protein